MVAHVNSAEGGTNGATVTVANSGGASGNPWASRSIPSGTTITYATAAAYKGTLGYRMTQGTASGTGANLRRSVTGWSKFRDRWYFRTSALPSVAVQLAYVTNYGNTKVLAKVILLTSGKLRIQNAAGTTLWTSAAAITLNTWYRIEWAVIPGTTTSNGTIRFWYAAGDAAVTESYATTAANTGTGGNLGTLYVGKLSGTWNATVDYDDFAADDTTVTTPLGASSSGPVVVDPAPPPPDPIVVFDPSDVYNDAIRSGSYFVEYIVAATYGGAPVEGATDLRPTGGTIVDTAKPGVRRTLNLQLAPSPGRFNLLAPIGTTLTVTARITYQNRDHIDIPMGVYDVDSQRMSEGGGGLSLTAPDKWVHIQRARFVTPEASDRGALVVEQIATLIRGALGQGEPVVVNATSDARMPALTWEKDRDKAILDLAKDIGAWVYFDRNGVATIDDIPTIGATADWLIDSSASGVLIELDRERSRTDTANVVVVESSASGGAKFPPQYVWDDDEDSPTYAGTNPKTAPETAGPFRIVTTYHDTPVLQTAAAGRAAGKTILARVSGLASQVSLGQVPNPAMNAFHVIDVLPPKERYDIPRVLERHIADTVTHPLTFGPSLQIEGRSTRAEDIVGGS